MTINHFMIVYHTRIEPLPDSLYILQMMVTRAAFPIYAFLITEGLLHTGNRKNYLFRLFLFACISEHPFNLAFSGNWINTSSTNVFCTLFLGAVAIVSCEGYTDSSGAKSSLCVALCTAAAFFLRTDYGAVGVLLIAAFHAFRNDRSKLRYSVALLFTVGMFLELVLKGLVFEHSVSMETVLILTIYSSFAVCALPLIFRYNGSKGRSLPKFFYYAYYPTHLLLLYFFTSFLEFSNKFWIP